MTASFLKELDQAILNGSPESRERALWYATDLLMVGQFSDEETWVFGEVIGRLAAEIELAARANLAAKLCRIDHAPGRLIDKLASDNSIEVAGPILRYSERVDDRTLLRNATTKDQQHLLAISMRRSISEPVTDVLVTRGDQAVAQAVATNAGARLSEAGFLNLIKRSENDGILAENIGLRQDIPRHLFQQLIARASDETRRKLERERPDMIAAVDALVADATACLHSKFGPASPVLRRKEGRFIQVPAWRVARVHHSRIRPRQENGRDDCRTYSAVLAVFRRSRAITRRTEPGVAPDPCQGIPVLWETTEALLFLGAPHFTISNHELGELRDQFASLHVSSSQEILAHYRDRKIHISSSGPRRLPELHAF